MDTLSVVMNMRQNETIKTNLYVLLAVLVVLAAGLTTALALDQNDAAENEQAQNEEVKPDSDMDTDAANLEAGAIKMPQKAQPETEAPVQKADAGLQQDKADTTTYALRTKDGCLQVYILETGDFFMETSIVYRLLPESVQAQIDQGKFFESEEALFEFLENYSS